MSDFKRVILKDPVTGEQLAPIGGDAAALNGHTAEEFVLVKDASFAPLTHNHTKSEITDFAHTHTKAEITDFPSSLPASDVYSWAKASSKPSYAWSEITNKPSIFTPATHTHAAGDISSGILSVARGGTGVTSLEALKSSLGAADASSIYETINKSSLATIASEFAIVSNTVMLNATHTGATLTTSYVLKHTCQFTLTGIGGYSKRIKIKPTLSTGKGNMNNVYAKFILKLDDGSSYTSNDKIIYQYADLYWADEGTTESKDGVNIDISQPIKGSISATLEIYLKCTSAISGQTSSGIILNSIKLLADKMNYV